MQPKLDIKPPKSTGGALIGRTLDPTEDEDLSAIIQKHGLDHGFAFVVVPIAYSDVHREVSNAMTSDLLWTRSDTCLTSAEWSQIVVAKLSTWVDLGSEDEAAQRNSENAVRQELAWCQHLAVPAIMFNLVANPVPMASILNSTTFSAQSTSTTAIWVNLKVDPNSWRRFCTLRTLISYPDRLMICLEVLADLPNNEYLARWLGEPISSFVLDTSLFITNKSGFPVLPKMHQLFVGQMLASGAQAIISGDCLHEDKGIAAYTAYVEYVRTATLRNSTWYTQYSKNYEDALQHPLQPLGFNLESATYETFENDPTKYTLYRNAVKQALKDKNKETCVVMVLGAGRGPLVNATLIAATEANAKVRIYAVEKNVNAIVTLKHLQRGKWSGSGVAVVCEDMRSWQAPEKADIIISELLGSFGDNELSPECLDGAQRLLLDDGVMIPQWYASYVQPIMSQKLWLYAANASPLCKEDTFKHPEFPYEIGYVVRPRNCNVIDKPQKLFEFSHPNKDLKDNYRYKTLTFHSPIDVLCHGFVGYFDCILYGDVTMSILPSNHSPDMISWFPIFFPVTRPFLLKANDDCQFHFWRRGDKRYVWYEWTVEQPITLPLHNPNGRSYKIGL